MPSTMKNILALLVLTAFIFSGISAQDTIPVKKVPPKVVKTFERKNSKATDVVWFKDGDIYTVHSLMNGQKMENKYDRMGKWLEGKTWMEDKSLPSKVDDYLRKEFGGHRFESAYLFQNNKREKHIVVFMTRKIRGYEDPFVWEVWFTHLGQYISTFEPDIPDDEAGGDLPPDKRFQKQVDKNLDIVSEAPADEKINKKDLPTVTLDYLKENYDHEWIYKEILIRETDDMGTVYYVIMKRQGYSETWEHYFDYKGELIKRTRLDVEE